MNLRACVSNDTCCTGSMQEDGRSKESPHHASWSRRRPGHAETPGGTCCVLCRQSYIEALDVAGNTRFPALNRFTDNHIASHVPQPTFFVTILFFILPLLSGLLDWFVHLLWAGSLWAISIPFNRSADERQTNGHGPEALIRPRVGATACGAHCSRTCALFSGCSSLPASWIARREAA